MKLIAACACLTCAGGIFDPEHLQRLTLPRCQASHCVHERYKRANPGPGHWRHDLRQLRGARREGAEEGARRAERQRQPGDRIGARDLRRRRGHGARAAPGRARRRLRAARRRCGAGCARRRAMGRLCAHRHRLAAVRAAGVADAADALRHSLDAARVGAVCAGHAGAVLARRALLQGGLGRVEGRQRQYGTAGRHRHHGGVAAVDVAVAVFRPRRARAPVL